MSQNNANFNHVVLDLESYDNMIEELAETRRELEELKAAVTIIDSEESDENENALVIVEIDLDTIAPKIEAAARLQIFGKNTFFGPKVSDDAPDVRIKEIRFTRQSDKRVLVGKARIIK